MSNSYPHACLCQNQLIPHSRLIPLSVDASDLAGPCRVLFPPRYPHDRPWSAFLERHPPLAQRGCSPMCSPYGLRLHPLRGSRWGRRRSGQTLELQLGCGIVSQGLATGGQRWVQTFWFVGVGGSRFRNESDNRASEGLLAACSVKISLVFVRE